jgi:hypothetical protein
VTWSLHKRTVGIKNDFETTQYALEERETMQVAICGGGVIGVCTLFPQSSWN